MAGWASSSFTTSTFLLNRRLFGAVLNYDADDLVKQIIRIGNAHLTTAGSIHQRDTTEAVPKKNTSLLKDPLQQIYSK